jgi:hypothetical protein
MLKEREMTNKASGFAGWVTNEGPTFEEIGERFDAAITEAEVVTVKRCIDAACQDAKVILIEAENLYEHKQSSDDDAASYDAIECAAFNIRKRLIALSPDPDFLDRGRLKAIMLEHEDYCPGCKEAPCQRWYDLERQISEKKVQDGVQPR